MVHWHAHLLAEMKSKFHLFLFVLFTLMTSLARADELIIEPAAGRAPLLSAINHAQTSTQLVMYGLTDKTLIDALVDAKSNVQILLEPHPYKATDENNYAVRKIKNTKINLRWANPKFQLTHQKTFLFDAKTAIVMTFNLTHSTFTRERNFALILTDPSEIQEIQRVFNADFTRQAVSVTNSHLVWSPENSREKILALIRSATTSMQIYAQEVSDYQIIGALAKAAKKDVKVEILLSSPSKKMKNKLTYLAKAGVIIHTSRHTIIHAKVLVLDHKQALLGSINFTKASLDDNRELSVITEDHNILHQVDKTFEQDWLDSNALKL